MLDSSSLPVMWSVLELSDTTLVTFDCSSTSRDTEPEYSLRLYTRDLPLEAEAAETLRKFEKFNFKSLPTKLIAHTNHDDILNKESVSDESEFLPVALLSLSTPDYF